MKIEIDKPVVPKWFDEWYKTFDDNKPVALYHLNRTGWGYGLKDGNDCEVDGFADKLKGLFGDYGYGDAQEYLSKAILLGYEIKREPLYYAKIKGWENKHLDNPLYWNHITFAGGENQISVADYVHELSDIYAKTIQNWNELGINDTNADFEEVD